MFKDNRVYKDFFMLPSVWMGGWVIEPSDAINIV